MFYPSGLQGQKAVPGRPSGQPSGLRLGTPHVPGLLWLPRERQQSPSADHAPAAAATTAAATAAAAAT